MRRLNPLQVQHQTVSGLGLDPQLHALTSVEALSAALRRAAGFLCPCAATSLVRSVLAPMRGLVSDAGATKARIEETLEHLVAHGDLIEYRDLSGAAGSAIVLYAAPCGFVPRSSGSVILVGISADQISALPPDLEARIVTSGFVRHLQPSPHEALRDELVQIGLIEIPYSRWTKAPTLRTAEQHVAHYDHLLAAKPSTGDVQGLVIIDPSAFVRFYPGRWVEPKGRTGRFVARRVQAYGAPLWCYVQLQEGQAEFLLDLPTPNGRWRGCDEAWHLQMAIDSSRRDPQQFGLRGAEGDALDLMLYSPIPMWAQRRWDAVGHRVELPGCLFAYRFPVRESEEETRFAASSMWLQAAPSIAQRV